MNRYSMTLALTLAGLFASAALAAPDNLLSGRGDLQRSTTTIMVTTGDRPDTADFPRLNPATSSSRAFGDVYDLALVWFCEVSGNGNFLTDPDGDGPGAVGPCASVPYDGNADTCGANDLGTGDVVILDTEVDNGDGTFTVTIEAANSDGSDMLPDGFACAADDPITDLTFDLADLNAGGVGVPGDSLDPNIGVSPFNIFSAQAILFDQAGPALQGALASEGTVATELRDSVNFVGANAVTVTAIQFVFVIGPDPMGACCLADNSCVDDQTDADCQAQGGGYEGNGTTCADTVCQAQATGACCDGATCTNETQSVCENVIGGRYKGDGTDCATSSCTGACCDGLTCSNDSTPEDCPGTYLGDDTTCGQVGPNSPDCEADPVPTMTEWGVIILALLLVTAGVVVVQRRQANLS